MHTRLLLCLAGSAALRVAAASDTLLLVDGNRLPDGARTIAYGGRTAAVAKPTQGRERAFVSANIDDREASGWILRLGSPVDLSARRDGDVLELVVRPASARIFAAFVDGSGSAPGEGIQSRRGVVPPDTAKGWSTVRVPLWQFSSAGARWNMRTKALESGRVDWKDVREFRIVADKGGNAALAGKDGMAAVEIAAARVVPGDMASRKPAIAARELGTPPTDKAVAVFFQDGAPSGSWDYSYGGTTDALTIEDASGRAAFVYRGDDREYSGWSIHLARPVDIAPHLAKGALEFRIRSLCGGERVVAGLIDDESDGPAIKTQARVSVSEHVAATKEWQTVSIPLSEFGKRGMWWDAARGVEVDAPMDWSRIQEFRVSSDRGANRACRDASGRLAVQMADVRIVPVAAGRWDAAAHWKAFRSGAAPEVARDSGAESKPRTADWSRHAALEIEIASDSVDRVLRTEIVDSSGELWIAGLEAPRGAARRYLPFSAFQRAWNQPAGAGSDRRFDLGRVRSFRIAPSGDLRESAPAAPGVGIVRLVNDPGPGRSIEGVPMLRSNLLGWRPGAPKRFFFAGSEREFALLDSAGKAVLTGSLDPAGVWEATGDSLRVGDFGRWTRPGTWRLAVGRILSEPFRIGDDVYDSLVAASAKAFYFQRATALDPSHAGRWAHPAGHPDSALPLLEAREAVGTRDVGGGWYDAGDYGKYVVNAGISVSTLLLLQEIAPKILPDRSLGIPESGNGRGDLLDEVLFETRWFERMQDKDGGVFFKVASRRWSGFTPPELDTLPRFVIGKSTSSTLNFAAAMAQCARMVRTQDPKRSERLLVAARKAWSWAVRNPSVPAPSETGGSGSYGDDQFADEFLWAAVELWRASGSPKERAEVVARLRDVRFTPAPTWAQTQDLALFSLALAGKDSLARWAAARVEELADSIHVAIEGNAARIPLESFIWGSNSLLLNHGMALVVSHRVNGTAARLDDLQDLLDYTLGRNALATSFVTGFGARAPRHPHHRLVSGRDAIPGFLSGGPNQARQDDLVHNPWGVLYPWREPARCWLDQTGSYASNEIAINWNASLLFVAGYLAKAGR